MTYLLWLRDPSAGYYSGHVTDLGSGTQSENEAEVEWTGRFLKRLDHMKCNRGVLGAMLFGLERYRADPRISPEKVADEFYAVKHSAS